MLAHLLGKKRIITFALTLSAATCLSASAEESNKDTPMFGDPRGLGATQLVLGGGEALTGARLLNAKEASIPKGLQSDLNAATAELEANQNLFSPNIQAVQISNKIHQIQKRNEILNDMGNRSSIEYFDWVHGKGKYIYYKADLEHANQVDNKTILELKARPTISVAEKQLLVNKAARKLTFVREEVLKARKISLLIKSVKRIAGGLLILDAADRAYVWFADKKDPTLAPVGHIASMIGADILGQVQGHSQPSVGQMKSTDYSAVFKGDRMPAFSTETSAETEAKSSASATNGGDAK